MTNGIMFRFVTWVLNYEVATFMLKELPPPKPARIFLDIYPVQPGEDVFQTPEFEPLFLEFLDGKYGYP